MPITITERVSSRDTSGGDSPTYELSYTIEGTSNEADALASLKAATNSFISIDNRILHRQSYEVNPLGAKDNEKWYGTASYGKANNTQDPEEEAKFSFSISAVSTHINLALSTPKRYPEAGQFAAPDPQNMIGINPDGTVDGAEIITPVYTFGQSKFFEDADITEAYRTTLMQTVGRINNGTFRSHPEGEVRCDGVDGEKIDTDLWELSFKFSVKENRDDIVVALASGEVTIEKEGWQIQWIYNTTGSMLWNGLEIVTQKPQLVYICDVYEKADFALLSLDAGS
jgi:hypothetical protein